MYLLFLDESGTPPANAKVNQRYFVIGGLVIPAAEWRTVHDRLQGLKTRKGIRGEVKWRYFAPGNDDVANPMALMKFEERDAIRTEILKIIVSVPSIRIVASVTSVKTVFKMTSIENANDVYALTYKTVTERFQYFLQDLNKQTGREECGMVVCDHRGADDDRTLRAHHQKLIGNPQRLYTSRYNNFVETLFFAPSHLSTGIQLADIVAGSIWRKFEKDDSRCYDLLTRAIRKGPQGQVDGYGIVKVPKDGWE